MNRNKILSQLLLLSSLCVLPVRAQSVHRQLWNEGWTFVLDGATTSQPHNLKTSQLPQAVRLPHDWAIEGDFSEKNPSGTGGGALPGGRGVYAKTFVVPASERGRCLRVDFDGVYMDAEVLINGRSLGKRPYGYIPFGYDITPYVKYNKENTLTVIVDNTEQPNSRWYSGCGIYRNVWFTSSHSICVAPNGTYVTSDVEGEHATLHVQLTLVNPRHGEVCVEHALLDARGVTVASCRQTTRDELLDADLTWEHPQLWDVERPYLYTLVTRVLDAKGSLLDEYHTTTGVRTFEFNDREGFVLNGRKVTINGVCNHHDLGCLGAAVNVRAMERQLQLLKEMGCNGIRCSHNPPAPELLDLCDRMGFIVMDEAFDMWRKKKTQHDYARYFNEWHERDLRDFIVRDRNHPCIFMWSIGNEVLEQWSDASADTLSLEEANLILNFGHSPEMLAKEGGEMSVNSLLTRKLADFVRRLDDTRPITAGCNEPSPGNHLFASGALDIIGFNYHNQNVPDVHRNFPGKPFIITESNSALMTRGYYRMPSDSAFLWPVRWDIPFADPSFACSSYDHCHAPWGNTHEENLLLMRRNAWIAGQYVWTGFDYIGEPTPYGWPARSSYFGIIDLAGFPKDVYYLYQSEWTQKPTLHLFPHWNWKEGETVDMWCYYNDADEVELFVNGRSQGIRQKSDSLLHAVWRTTYVPGHVTVVARKNGREVRQQTISTAGPAAQLRLTADRTAIQADGTDLAFVTVEVLDAEGNLCPLADNEVEFEVEGEAFIAGVDNGSPTSLERFKASHRKAFNGRCLVVLQSNGKQGEVKLTARSKGLASQSMRIRVLRNS